MGILLCPVEAIYPRVRVWLNIRVDQVGEALAHAALRASFAG